MRQDEPADAGFLRHLSTLAGVEMDRIWLARWKRTVQHGKIGVAAEPHEIVTIL